MKFKLIFFFLLSSSVMAYCLPFRFIVASDGSGDYTTIQAAINACPDNERSIVFVKNGTYYGQTSIGTKTTASNKIISLIGENRDSVILTYDKSLTMVSTFELATTFQIYAKNFYAENITFVNSAGNTGQALALYTAGDMATFKNCTVRGYQDTYRAKKGTRGYFYKCWIEGAVDFIYAGGTVFFDDCTINCVKGGGYIVAPEDRYKYIPAASTTTGKDLNLEFIFRNCNITANSDVSDNTFTLGRPWNTYAGAYYINCKLGSHIKAAGWTTMSGNETTASFAEYNSMDKDGNPVNTSGRVSWSFQLAKEDVDNFLNPDYVYAQLSTTVYDPVSICVAPAAPELTKNGNTISWNTVSDAAGYIIYKDGKYSGVTTETTYTDSSSETGNYTVRAINSTGVLSDTISSSTGISDVKEENINLRLVANQILFDQVQTKIELYNLSGMKVCQAQNSFALPISNIVKGAYIIRVQTAEGQIIKRKLEI